MKKKIVIQKESINYLLKLSICIIGVCVSPFTVADHIKDYNERLERVGLKYSLPAGFVDVGPYTVFERELTKTFNSVDPFVVHQIRSNTKKITGYLDIRVLGRINLKDPRFFAYPLVFESNAESYCSMFSGSDCSVLAKFPSEAVASDYNADLGMIFKANSPKSPRIGGHKKAMLVAVSKPSKGLFYIMIAYDSDKDFNDYFESIMYSLKFK